MLPNEIQEVLEIQQRIVSDRFLGVFRGQLI
jgi:hypothetical protein